MRFARPVLNLYFYSVLHVRSTPTDDFSENARIAMQGNDKYIRLSISTLATLCAEMKKPAKAGFSVKSQLLYH